MTTDFLVTLSNNQDEEYRALCFKPTSAFQTSSRGRLLERLEIERTFWARRGIPWQLITERQFSNVVTKNLVLLRDYFKTDSVPLNQEAIEVVINLLTPQVRNAVKPLREITMSIDKQLGLNPGASLTVAYHLLATRVWKCNLNSEINPGKPLRVLE
jgi:hypothetical protein